MVNGTKIQIKDTGLNKVGGSVIYTPVASGAWISLSSFNLRGEFTVNTTDNQSLRSSDSSMLSFKSNELSTLLPPRFTLSGAVLATDNVTIQNIVKLGRSKGIKRITGGLAMISALPEKQVDTYDYISVIIKNITFSEIVADSKDYVAFTIQLEQVN